MHLKTDKLNRFERGPRRWNNWKESNDNDTGEAAAVDHIWRWRGTGERFKSCCKRKVRLGKAIRMGVQYLFRGKGKDGDGEVGREV